MDYCHYLKPEIIAGAAGGVGDYCARCRLWYDEKQWRQDSRVIKAQREAKELDNFVDEIMIYGDLVESARREAERKQQEARETRKIKNRIKRFIAWLLRRN